MKPLFFKLVYSLYAFVFLINPAPGLGQELRKVDSLHTAYMQAGQDTTRILILTQIAFNYYEVNRDTCILLAQKALHWAKEIKYAKGQAAAYTSLGDGYASKCNYQVSLNCYEQALDIYVSLKHKKGQAQLHNKLGLNWKSQNQAVRAFQHFFDALRLYEELKYWLGLSAVNANIALLFNAQKEHQIAKPYYHKALQAAQKSGSEFHIGLCLSDLGSFYKERQQYDSAWLYLEKARCIQQKIEDKVGLCMLLGEFGEIHEWEGDDDLAQQKYDESLQMAESIHFEPYICTITAKMARLCLKRQHYEQAIYYAQKGLQKGISIHRMDKVSNHKLLLSQIYEALERPMLALTFYKEHKKLEDSLFNLAKSREINRLELQRKELENERLLKDNQLKDLHLRTSQLEKERQAQSLLILAKEAEATRFMALALHEKDQRRSDSFRALAQRAHLEAVNLRVKGQKIAAENHAQSLVIAQAKQNASQQFKLNVLFFFGIVGLFILALVLYLSRQRIEKARRQVAFLNQNLEAIVASRTAELKSRNSQLASYAFMNAHKVRGPLARVLGLFQVLEIQGYENATETAILIANMQRAALEMDFVIQEINQQLENEELAEALP
ncbi:MAG: hypothetical protein OHK0053_18680 [Microscillaceae bacterium]